jgi:C4-dicarboxylate-specific signal transduction histidine kinase
MSPKVKKKMFEPFYNKKGIGKGTGIGLAMVYGIIKKPWGIYNCLFRDRAGHHCALISAEGRRKRAGKKEG